MSYSGGVTILQQLQSRGCSLFKCGQSMSTAYACFDTALIAHLERARRWWSLYPPSPHHLKWLMRFEI